jgi:LysM repeat protein
MRSGMKKRTSKSSKRKLRAARNHYTNTVDSLTLAKTTVQGEPACQTNVPVAKFAEMKVIGIFCAISAFTLWTVSAESPVPHEGKSAQSAQLEALAKKIDEQNAKIDALSQEILKLEQQLSHARPGVMIGEAAPAPATAAAAGASASHSAVEGNVHTVARGETLTSIAKMYKVTVDDLQKANHIEDGRKLQAGQTIIIPTASPAASGSPSP